MGNKYVSKSKIGKVIEDWVNGVNINIITKRHHVTQPTVSRWITKLWLYNKETDTETITRQSKGF